ncbi:MAG: ABC transporter ATP-binding protein [Azospirillaceae bacterium]
MTPPPEMRPRETPLLETRGLEAFYGDFQALFGIDFTVGEGETVAIIGSNGAGKSTFLKSITGLIANVNDAIRYEGAAIGSLPAHRVVRLGIAMVPEGRRLFPSLSVEENLLIGATAKRRGTWTLDTVYDLFPILKERRHNPGTALSGGQQQMVAVGRALMANPRLLLCDEISLGLAPVVIKDIYAAVPRITREGTTVVVVEQDINQAMAVADRVYCFQEGRVSLEGRPGALSREQITAAYFGL